MDDSYINEFDARVTVAGEGWCYLDQTSFYPRGGGLCSDTGFIIRSSREKLRVREVVKDRETGEGQAHYRGGYETRGRREHARCYRLGQEIQGDENAYRSPRAD